MWYIELLGLLAGFWLVDYIIDDAKKKIHDIINNHPK